MTACTLASQSDAVPAASHLSDAAAGFHTTDDQHLALLRALTASWHPVSTVADRRPGHRIPCNLPAELVPLDERGRLRGALPLAVQLVDLSDHGIGIMHPHPMPHRLVLVTFETEIGKSTRLVVRLKWCRFKRADFYQSGGQILRVLSPVDDSTHLTAT